MSDWKRQFMAKKSDGSFRIFNSQEEMESADGDFTGEYCEVDFNFNKGQPIVRLPNGDQVSIVDIDYKS